MVFAPSCASCFPHTDPPWECFLATGHIISGVQLLLQPALPSLSPHGPSQVGVRIGVDVGSPLAGLDKVHPALPSPTQLLFLAQGAGLVLLQAAASGRGGPWALPGLLSGPFLFFSMSPQEPQATPSPSSTPISLLAALWPTGEGSHHLYLAVETLLGGLRHRRTVRICLA